jgi:hypothetical protein
MSVKKPRSGNIVPLVTSIDFFFDETLSTFEWNKDRLKFLKRLATIRANEQQTLGESFERAARDCHHQHNRSQQKSFVFPSSILSYMFTFLSPTSDLLRSCYLVNRYWMSIAILPSSCPTWTDMSKPLNCIGILAPLWLHQIRMLSLISDTLTLDTNATEQLTRLLQTLAELAPEQQRLHSVTLMNWSPSKEFTSLTLLPLQSLRHLRITSCRIPFDLSVLSNHPSLEDVRIEDTHLISSSNDGIARIAAPHLCHLELGVLNYQQPNPTELLVEVSNVGTTLMVLALFSDPSAQQLLIAGLSHLTKLTFLRMERTVDHSQLPVAPLQELSLLLPTTSSISFSLASNHQYDRLGLLNAAITDPFTDNPQFYLDHLINLLHHIPSLTSLQAHCLRQDLVTRLIDCNCLRAIELDSVLPYPSIKHLRFLVTHLPSLEFINCFGPVYPPIYATSSDGNRIASYWTIVRAMYVISSVFQSWFTSLADNYLQ